MQDEHDALSPTRRSMLRGGAAAGLALPLVAACGTASPGASPSTPATQRRTGAAPLVRTSQVPVGGGKILADTQIVVTQPTRGKFKAFSAVCTHLQCLVTQVEDRRIICPCHGSEFSIEDGSVVRGPATQHAAELLNVSRPFLIGLLDAGEIEYRKVGKHRRIQAQSLLAYMARDDQKRREAADELTRLNQELGLL